MTQLDPHIFREYDVRGIVPTTLNEEAARAIGMAFGQEIGGTICIGYDGRLSSPALKDALIEGLCAAGCDVAEVGLGPTPMLYYAVCTTPGAAGGIMVTGSHNPPDHNGFKFMRGTKPFFGEEIRRLGQTAASRLKPAATPGQASRIHARAAYLEELCKAYRAPSRLTVAWDAGNGAAGEVMALLAARLPGKHFLLNQTIDGRFPVHHPDPAEEKNLVQLQETVREHGCDLGIAFDGDGDRIGAVDGEGEILWGDQLLALYAADLLAEQPGATVIADVKASQALFDEVVRLGGTPLLWKTGHSHIKSKMQETGAKLAGEMSGHMFFADRYFGFDDALYAAVRLIDLVARSGRSLAELRRALPQRVNTPEIRFPCDDARKFTVIEEVKARLRAAGAQFLEVDGVRVTTPDGWWLLRASNTQAVLVARCEAADKAGLERLKQDLRAQLALSKVALP